MAFENDISQLGVEYFEAAEIIKERIGERLSKLRVLRAKGKLLTDEAYILKSELNSLYREYNDTVNIADYLKNYYTSNMTLDNILI